MGNVPAGSLKTVTAEGRKDVESVREACGEHGRNGTRARVVGSGDRCQNRRRGGRMVDFSAALEARAVCAGGVWDITIVRGSS